MKPLWFSLSGIELVNKNTTEKYLYSAHFYCCFTYSSIFKPFHIFSNFFRFRWKKPISSSKPSQFPGGNEHVNSNATVKYWCSAQLCCCFIGLENYNFLQEKILPIRYSSIFKLFLIFTPVSSTSSGRNYFFQEAITVYGFTSLGRNNNKIFIFNTFLAVVSLVLRITA